MQKTLGIQDLEAYTGLPRRTIHFYVKEGLIPPPDGAGRGAYYGWHHVHALKLISALKEGTHLRLEGIGEILQAMDRGEMGVWARAIENGERTAGELAARQAVSAPHADRPLEEGPAPDFDLALMTGEPARMYFREAPEKQTVGEAADESDAQNIHEDEAPTRARMGDMSEHDEETLERTSRSLGILGMLRRRSTPGPPHETWERIRLADDVELQVREGTDRKRRRKIEEIARLAAEMLDD